MNITGYLEFTVKGGAGETFCRFCGEVLDAEGHVGLRNMQQETTACLHLTMKIMARSLRCWIRLRKPGSLHWRLEEGK